MAEDSKDLIFPMRLDVDLDKFQQDWKEREMDIQKIIDKTKFKLNISVDGDATKIIKVGEDIGKATKEAEILIGTLRAMREEANTLSNQSLDLNIDEQSAEIKQLILDARRLRSEIEGHQLAPMSLGEIGKIGGSQPTGLDLKQRKKELELYLLAEKEGTQNAIRANKELAEVKERLRNLVGKQESALKNTDEEKRVTSTIAAYKKLGDEIDRITAKARERVSRQSGMVIEPSAMTPDMFTSNEKAAIDQLRLSMDAYKSSINEANQAKLNPTALEASKREVALNRENEAIRKAITSDTKKQESALKALESAYKREEDTVSRIQTKIAQLEKIKPKIAFDASGSAKLDSELTRLRGKLQSMMSPTDSLKMKLKELDVEWGKLSAKERSSAKGREVIKKFNELSQAANGATSSLRAAASAQSRLDAAAMKSKYSLDLSSDAVKKHNGLLNGMPQFLNAYISVLGAYRISKNIIDTTAEFEMQRVALNAIIQDKRKADELFSQVVELGIRSPFQIKELITYTKQLAAFRVETDKLFSTTKMLADISAGLGVGMDRLILAFGQVRAASVLRGQELRQFTEAGIPLVDLLADKVSIMNGKLTTTGDIFEMISKRQISFDMIEEVFEDMTKAGGTFYNMQEVMAETLQGQISNLRDAYDKMFMEMGESQVDTVKLILSGARSIAENWKEVTDAIGAGVVAYGAYRLAMIATNALVGKSALATMNLVKAKKMEEINNILVAKSYRQLTTAERFKLQTDKEVSASDYRRAIMAKKLNGEELLRLVALKKIKPEMAKRIISTRGLTRAEKALFLEQVKVNASQIDYAAGLGLFRVTALRLGAAIKGVVMNLKAMSMALLTNPMTWIMAIGAGVAMLGSKIAGFRTKYSDLDKTLRDKTGALASEMGEAWKNIADTVGKGFEAGATDEVMFSARKEMENILRKNELLSNVIDQRLLSLTSEKEKLEEIRDIWEEITNPSSANPFVGGQKSTGSIANKDVVQNVNKVEDAYQKAYDILVKASKTMNVTPIKTQLEDIHKQLMDGTISAKGFSDAILNIRKQMVSEGLANTDLYVPFGTALGKMERSMTTFQKDWDTFLRESIAGMETINGEQPVFGADNFGLSEENLKIFKTRVSTMFDAWLLAQEGMGNVSRAMMRNQAITGLMLTGVEPPKEKLSKFGEWYNNQLSNPNLSLAGKKMELGKERTESEVGDELSKSLTQNKADLERYQRQVLAGVDINKDEVESLRNVIAAQEELSRLLGLKDKEASKTNPRIAELETELDLIKTAYNKYKDLLEVMPESQAKEKIRQMYGSGTPLAFSFGDMDKEYERIISELESLGKDASKAAHKAFMSQSEDGIKEVVDSVTRDLKDVLDGVDSAMKGQDVYRKMLGMTGNADIAKGLTEALGLTTKSVRQTMSNAIQKIMGKGVAASEENIDKLPKKQADVVRQLIANLQKYEQAELETALGGLEKFLTAEQRKVIIAENTQREIDAINNSALSATDKSRFVSAIQKRGDAQTAGVDLDVLMQSETLIRAFQDMDRVGILTLRKIREDLLKVAKAGGLSAENMKRIEDQIQKIDSKLEGQNPFDTLSLSLEEYRNAIAETSEAQRKYGEESKEYRDAQDKVYASSDKVKDSIKSVQSGMSDAASSIQSAINATELLAEALGLSFSEETQEYIDAFNKGMEFASVAVGILSVAFGVLSVAAAPFTIIALAIVAALGIMFVKIKLITDLINMSSDKKLKAIDKSIGDVTDRLEELKRAEDDLIGGAYTKNMKEQIEANEELIRLEKERIEEAKKHRNFLGFKAPDKDQIEESTNAIKDYKAEIESLQKTTMSYITGYDSAIAAADAIASAWYDAWLSSADAMDAIGDKFDEMIDNMIVKSLLAELVAIRLESVFDFIRKSYENDGRLDMDEIRDVQGMISGLGQGINDDLTRIMGDWIRSGGNDRRGDEGNLSGISASVKSLSEDTAITLGGYFNSNLVQLLRQTQLLQIIAARDIETPLKDLHGLQQQSLNALNGIKNDTVLMVGHLSRLVQTQQDLMIRGGSKAVNVHLVN